MFSASKGLPMPRSRFVARPVLTASIAAVTAAALLGVGVIPAHGAEPPSRPTEVPVVGGLSVGDELESLIDERDGSLGITVSAGGVDLGWDSRAALARNRFDLGEGWSFGFRFLDTSGGVRLVMPTGEVFEADESAPSGLHGYTLEDLKLARVERGALPPRDDLASTITGDPAYALYELGGRVTYFDGDGNPAALVGPFGERTDLQWSARRPHQLERIVDPDGVTTELDWASEEDTLVVRRRAHVPPDTAAGPNVGDPAWRVAFDADGRVDRIIDPEGGETEFVYDGAVLGRIRAASGATSEIDWHTFDDGIARVERVQVLNRAGRAITSRSWKPRGATTASGWPVFGGADELHQVDVPEFETELSDGSTTVRSAYAAQHLLRTRELVGSTPVGEQVLQRQTFDYPLDALSAGSSVLGSLLSRPERVEVTHLGASGATRSSATEYAYDPSGRVIRETSEDGVPTETAYDGVVPAGAPLPIGLPVRETTSTPDGLVREVTSALNDERTAVTASETYVSGGPEAHPRTLTARLEYTVAPDGFVAEERRFPVGETAAGPDVTRWSETIDPTRGTKRTVETRGMGTDAEASVSETTSLLHGGAIEQTDELGRSSSTEYDLLGRVVHAADGTRYVYDALNRPISEVASDGTATAVEYWADGARRSLTATDSAGSARRTEFLWDGETLVGESYRADGHESGATAYLIGAGRHARTVAVDGRVDTAYYGADRHGNVTELTDADGRVSEQYAYSDYGVELADGAPTAASTPTCTGGAGDAARNPFRYSGEYTDPSCRQHLAARSYDAPTMRFTSMDTEAVMNPFAYTDANPITRVDPTGNTWEEDALWNRLYMGMGAAGLLGTAVAGLIARFTTLAPLGPAGIALLAAGALGDVLGIVSGVIWEKAPPWMDAGVENVLSELDTAVSLSIIGIGFGARALYAVFDDWRTARAALRQQIRYEDSAHSSRSGGRGHQQAERARLIPDSQPSATKHQEKGLHDAGSDDSGGASSFKALGLWSKPDIPLSPGYSSYGFGTYAPTKAQPSVRTKAPLLPGKDPTQIPRSKTKPAATVTGPGSIQRRRDGSSSSASSSESSQPVRKLDPRGILQRLFN
jgi:RHS repeat-associated protein